MMSDDEQLAIINNEWKSGVERARVFLMEKDIDILSTPVEDLKEMIFDIWAETVSEMLKKTFKLGGPAVAERVAKNFMDAPKERKIEDTKNKTWNIDEYVSALIDYIKILKEKGLIE